jgi:hypothetical protein
MPNKAIIGRNDRDTETGSPEEYTTRSDVITLVKEAEEIRGKKDILKGLVIEAAVHQVYRDMTETKIFQPGFQPDKLRRSLPGQNKVEAFTQFARKQRYRVEKLFDSFSTVEVPGNDKTFSLITF